MERRKLLKDLGAGGIAALGLSASTTTGSASDPMVHVVLHRDYYADESTLGEVATHIDDNFDDYVPNVDVLTTESSTIGQPDVDDADPDNTNLVECWSKYVHQNFGFYENTIRMYICDSHEWMDHRGGSEGPGAAAGRGSVNEDGSHEMSYDTGLNPVCFVECKATDRDPTRDVDSVRHTAAHEIGHLCMSPDHNHPRMSNWAYNDDGTVSKTTMTVKDEDVCQVRETEKYSVVENDFGEICGTAIDEWVNHRETNDGLESCHYN